MGLMPMVEIHKPNTPENKPLTTDLEPSVPMTVTPTIAIQNISEGPNFSASFANGGVKKINTKTPVMPPTKELIKQKCNACVALPFLAIGWPSNTVAMLAGAPGILTKMPLIAPPATVAV